MPEKEETADLLPLEMIETGACVHFDPELAAIFFKNDGEMAAVYDELSE